MKGCVLRGKVHFAKEEDFMPADNGEMGLDGKSAGKGKKAF